MGQSASFQLWRYYQWHSAAERLTFFNPESVNMTTVANISINDATPVTPVTHVFVPIFQENGVWIYEDQSAETALGYNRIGLSLKRPPPAQAGEDSSKRVVRVKATVYTPILETLSNSTVSGIIPAPVISYISRASVELLLPERSVTLDRENLRAYLNGVLNNYQFTAMVDDFVGLTG